MTDFHFLRPWWFLALLPLAGTLWFMARQRLGASDWRAFCDPELLPHILLDAPASQSRLPVWLAGLTGVLAILALAEHLRLATLADGVATQDENAFLAQIGFAAVQGPAVAPELRKSIVSPCSVLRRATHSNPLTGLRPHACS